MNVLHLQGHFSFYKKKRKPFALVFFIKVTFRCALFSSKMVNLVESSDKRIADSIKGVIRNRKRRENLCLKDKLKIVELLENKKSIRDVVVALEGKVTKSTVQRISGDRQKLKEIEKEGLIKQTAKRMKNEARFHEIDDAVFKWFNLMRNPPHRKYPLPISRAQIQARAKMEAEMRKMENFSASDGWFQRWRKRVGIGKSMRLFGEAGDVDPEAMVPLIKNLTQSISSYPDHLIFNMDETGLYYCALPNQTYLSPLELRKQVRGSKALKAKDRLTLVLCVNATGKTYLFLKFKNIH